MKRKYEHYSDEFKLSVLRDYYSSGMSKYACVRKYHLSGSRILLDWLRKYGIEKDCVSLQLEGCNDEGMARRSSDDYRLENAHLKKRILELEKALEFSRLETLSRDMLIDKAEEYFSIPIRKKSGAK